MAQFLTAADILQAREALMAEVGRKKQLCLKCLDLSESNRKEAQRRLAKASGSLPADPDVAATLVENAEIAEAETKVARKHLATASLEGEAESLQLEKTQSELAALRAELKTLEAPGDGAVEALTAARKRYSMIRLRAAVANQRLAESELEAAEVELALAKRKVAVAKSRVERVKSHIETPGQEGEPDEEASTSRLIDCGKVAYHTSIGTSRS
jgi:chromosome segregation ATPase